MRCLALPVSLLVTLAPAIAQGETKRYQPDVKPASEEARRAMAKFELAPGFEVSLVAAEPMLANPVAFHIDHRGRIFVAETFRLHKGVTDNRSHNRAWLEDDIACRTVEDRVAMYRHHLGAKFASYEVEHERIRVLFDEDGDGVSDRSVVFADGFKEAADGIAAGVFAQRDGSVWYTCIPKLWHLHDDDGDGVADRRRAVHDGFGVHTALLGHDMHGLIWGPDGKLYFSIGDRGFSTTTHEGTLLDYPDTGAVLRCDRDGSNLEVFASGLRNPQELAFDKYGNLFTGDNNSDGGDRARWVYVAEGGDSGWRISFQSLRTRGPWNEEKLWHPHHAGQAAWILPPIANFAAGPSGLTYNPGTGLPPEYADHFFLCDFRGGSGHSGVRSIAVKPKGAWFEVAKQGKLIWRVLPTDVDFGPDGAMYISDWTEGWNQTGKGRIYRITASASRDSAIVVDTARILREGVAGLDVNGQLALLAHPDQRVRQLAQFALADRGASAFEGVVRTAKTADEQLARIHAIWALGQMTRTAAARKADVQDALAGLLMDGDAEIRAQAARVCGDTRATAGAATMAKLLGDASARVRYFAAMGVAKLGYVPAFDGVVAMVRESSDQDPFLRHAGVMALTSLARRPGGHDQLTAVAAHESAAVRMAVLLTLRRLGHPEVARYLDDSNPLLVVEAARAIYDLPIEPAMPALAAVIDRPNLSSRPLLRRAIDANYRLGEDEHARRVAAVAANTEMDSHMRRAALAALGKWPEPPARDTVLGLWRPLPARPPAAAQTELRRVLRALLVDKDENVQLATIAAIGTLPLVDADKKLFALVADEKARIKARVAALKVLERWKHSGLLEVARGAAQSKNPSMRREGLRIAAAIDPEASLPFVASVLRIGNVGEQRYALRILGDMPEDKGDDILVQWLGELREGRVPAHIRLDLVEAAEKRKSDAVKTALAAYQASKKQGDALAAFIETLSGGDANAGKRIFRNHKAATCTKCHSVDGQGGDAGPDLKGVGLRLVRYELLQSLIEPSAKLSEGYGTAVITLNNGRVHAGMIRGEDDKTLRLKPTDKPEIVIEKSKIIARGDPVSSMNPMGPILNRREIRDVIEYLASLK